MKQNTLKNYTTIIRMCVVATMLAVVSLFLFSFTVKRQFADEFLKQLGISKSTADGKMNSGFLYGSFDEYGLKKAKTIAVGNRAAIVKDVVAYAKKYVASTAFSKEYATMRTNAKPAASGIKTPEQLQKEMIEEARKSVVSNEASLKKADASMKPLFEKLVVSAKKELADAENPNNKTITIYRKNYAEVAKNAAEGDKRLLAEWEAKYPANHMLYIKAKLQQFLDETKDVDFAAQLTEKNGKKYFVNKIYEGQSYRWKMAFRAGKEAITTGRTLVEQWIAEIK